MKINLIMRGGLGNQLFQAAAGASLAKKFKVNVFLDDVSLARHQDVTRRSWIRKIEVGKLFCEDLLRFRSTRLTELRSRFALDLSKRFAHSESEINNLSSLTNSIQVYDWFHSSEYLPTDALKLKKEMIKDLRKDFLISVTEISESNHAAVHIRLGDFKQTPWGVLSKKWYVSAIRQLASAGVTRVDCYSDDIPEAEEIIGELKQDININFPEKKYQLMPHELLWKLSNYKHYVSSNSTLSWWAAYLNQHEDPFIISAWGDHLHQRNWYQIDDFNNV